MQFGRYKFDLCINLVWFVLFFYGGLVAQQNNEFHKRLDSLKNVNNYSEYIYTSLDEFSKAPKIENLNILENTLKNLWRNPLNQNEYLAQIYFNVNYGYYLKQFGFINESIFYYEKAKKIFEDHPSIKYNIIEFCYKPLANNYTRLGDFERAEDLLKVTITKSEQYNDRNNTLAAYSNLAIVKRSLGEFEKAIEYLKLILKKSHSQSFSSKIHSDLATNYLLLKDIKNANKFLRLSNSVSKDFKVLGKNHQTQGNIYLLKKDYEKAEMSFKKALPLVKKVFGNNDRELGKLHYRIAQCKMSLALYSEAILNYQLAIKTLIPKFNELEIEDNTNKNYLYPENTLLDSFDGMAKAYTFLGNLNNALESYNLSFLVEEQLRQTFSTQEAKLLQQQENKRRSEFCIEICYELFEKTKNVSWIEDALAYAESSKATVLNEEKVVSFNKSKIKEDSIFISEKELRYKKAQLNKKIALEELKLEQASVELLTQFTQERDQISNKLKLLKQIISEKYPFIDHTPKPITTLDIQKNILKDNQTLIEFFNGDRYIYRFVLPKKGALTITRIEKNNEFSSTIENFLGLFISGNRASIQNNIEKYSNLGFKLFKMLFSNVNNKSLIIVPDGQLSLIPFDALITEDTKVLNFEKLPYFVKDTELQLAYSATLLSLTKVKKEMNDEKVLGFFPIFENENKGLATLSYTKDEMDNIKSDWKGEYFRSEQALKSNFIKRSETASIIHLSTHASAGDFATPPSIEFFDETLYLPEIYGYNFIADLLVLSACETGLGILRKGEGAMSLARGFSYAGVKNLIVSLWKVNDKSTQELMTSFYRHLKKSNDKSLSLHKSKLDYLNNSKISSIKKSPYYWAGFTYIGENSIPQKHQFQLWWLFIPLFIVGGFFLLKKR